MTTPHGYDVNTDEYWEIEGHSLHQHGWSVATIGGSRFALPPRRGENQMMPYRPGTVWRPKVADARTLNLVMWVTGQYNLADGLPAADHRVAWNDSWDYLRRLVWKVEGRQFLLTRRWKLTVGGHPTIVTADARAELAGTMDPTMTGRHRADFQMDLLLADPYFYGRANPTVAWSATEVALTVNLQSDPVNTRDVYTAFNPGYDLAGYGSLEIDLIGPLKNPVVLNASPEPDMWVRFGATIDAGVTIRLSVPDFLAYQVSNNHNYIGRISHSGARHWMGLVPGANYLTLLTDEGTGSAVVRYQPPYV
jgi:hypothetical protein